MSTIQTIKMGKHDKYDKRIKSMTDYTDIRKNISLVSMQFVWEEANNYENNKKIIKNVITNFHDFSLMSPKEISGIVK